MTTSTAASAKALSKISERSCKRWDASTTYYSAACYSICVLISPLHTTLLHATRYVSSNLHCILLFCMLLDMCPHISTAYYSAACYSICVLKSLLHTMLHATRYVSSNLYCILLCCMLLYVSSDAFSTAYYFNCTPLCMCPQMPSLLHTTLTAHYSVCVLISYCMLLYESSYAIFTAYYSTAYCFYMCPHISTADCSMCPHMPPRFTHPYTQLLSLSLSLSLSLALSFSFPSCLFRSLPPSISPPALSLFLSLAHTHSATPTQSKCVTRTNTKRTHVDPRGRLS